jgi:hypothetical protein
VSQLRQGLFPFDRRAGPSELNLSPALERIATLAGTVAASFEKGAGLLQEKSGTRLGKSTIQRTSEDVGARLAQQLQSGQTYGRKVVRPWHKD